jgi:predicted metal-dependent phosphoesterase TrpH
MHGLVAVATVVVVFSASCHTALGLPRHEPQEAGQCQQHTLKELADAPALILRDAGMPKPFDFAWMAAPMALIVFRLRRTDGVKRLDLRERIRRLAWVWARGSPTENAPSFVPVYAPRSDVA